MGYAHPPVYKHVCKTTFTINYFKQIYKDGDIAQREFAWHVWGHMLN